MTEKEKVITEKIISKPLTFRFDQTHTLVTLDDADNDPDEFFKLNNFRLFFCVSFSSVIHNFNENSQRRFDKFEFRIFY